MELNFKKTWTIFLITVLFVSILGCSANSDVSSESNTDENENKEDSFSKTIVYGGSSWIAHIPAYIAVEKGFFEDEGLDVEFKSFATSSERMTALASGAVDFGSTGAISAISLMAAGDKSFSVFASPDIYVGQEGVVASKDISSFEDLRGEKIAVPFSSSSHVLLLDLLKENNLIPNKDVEVINMDGGDIVSAFTTGEINAAAIWSPYFNQIQDVEGAKVLATDTDTSIYKNYGFGAGPDVLVIRNDFIEENPEVTEKLIKAYFNAVSWLMENPTEAAELFVELSGLDVEEQADIIKSIDWLDIKDQKEILSDNGEFTQTLTFLSNFLYDNELISNEVDVKEWINIDIIPE